MFNLDLLAQFTKDFAVAPSLHSKEPSDHGSEHGPGESTPRASTPPPLDNQRTGDWSYTFPNFRQTLLGGKSLNRFSSFVTTGAEEWVLNGKATDEPPVNSPMRASFFQAEPTAGEAIKDDNDADDEDDIKAKAAREADRHFVDTGPAWKPKLPEFKILVHSPSKRSSTLGGAYTIYNVTSIFTPERTHETVEDEEPPSTSITVHRRFSHFVFLHTALTKRLPGIALPPLPEKQYAGRFSDDFVEARRGDLERYLNRIVRHPVARYAEVVTFFLSCESEFDWKKRIPHHLNLPPAGPQFYAKVYHPAFNLDAEDAADSVDKFQRHVKAIGKGVQGLRGMFGSLRAARVEMSKWQRMLSYSLLSLITSTPLASEVRTSPQIEDEEEEEVDHSRKGLLNSDGAWCWREDCDNCLRLTKAMQKTAESLQAVADLHDDNARRRQLLSHEALKDVAHPSELYQPVVETHKATLSRYKDALRDGANDEVAARCETVLNTTMAEFETYHTQKIEDFEGFMVDHLDGEIEFYEQVLARLRTARNAFEQSPQDGPRLPSIYERDLASPKLAGPPLKEPCPHVWDSAPMRPVSVAVQEGVGMLFGSSSSTSTFYGRGSVFGKFW